MRTFFLPADKWKEPYRLEGREAKHLRTVVRVHAGESIRLLDGEGREGIFTVRHIEKHAVVLEATGEKMLDAPAGRATLALGYTRSIRRSWLMEKAVELEAEALWLWQADHSQGKIPAENKETWFSQMRAGAKQSNNPWLPGLRCFPGGVHDLAAVREGFSRAFLLLEQESCASVLQYTDLDPLGKTLFVLGPEGGFSNREITVLRDSGFMPASLGRRVLRWETAALLCLGLSWWVRQQHEEAHA